MTAVLLQFKRPEDEHEPKMLTAGTITFDEFGAMTIKDFEFSGNPSDEEIRELVVARMNYLMDRFNKL